MYGIPAICIAPTQTPFSRSKEKIGAGGLGKKTPKRLAWPANPGTTSCLPALSARAPALLRSACPC